MLMTKKQYSEVTPDGVATLEAVFNKKEWGPTCLCVRST